MQTGTKLGMAWLLLGALAGCSAAHERTGDGGSPGADAAPSCRPGDPPSFDVLCLFISADHVCGDAAQTPTCVDGSWSCPPGTSSHTSDCWCPGLAVHGPECICTPGGWSCPPAPMDAGVPDASTECPADPSALVGSACPVEGATCGSCPMPCSGFCNLVSCTGHTWQAIELGCANPVFACGDRECARWSETCQHVVSDVVGAPDTYRCAPLPSDCPDDCSCFHDVFATCADDGAGGVTQTLGGG